MADILDIGLPGINAWAVVVAGLAHMVTGLVWFRPRVFGNAWTKFTGKEINPAPKWMVADLVGPVAIALVMAFIIVLADATTLLDGVIVGLLVLLGLI